MFMALASSSSEIAPVMGVTIGVAAVAGFANSGGFSGSPSTESHGSGSREGPASEPPTESRTALPSPVASIDCWHSPTPSQFASASTAMSPPPSESGEDDKSDTDEADKPKKHPA